MKPLPPSTHSNGTAAGPQPTAAQTLAAMAAETAALRQPGTGTVADTLAEWLATRYVIAAQRLTDEAGDDGLDLATLAKLSADVVALRKGDHSAERLRMERERNEQFMQARFEEWLKQPGMVERICGPKLTPEEKEIRMRQIFGLGDRPKCGLSAEALEQIEKAVKLL